jgi:hypothetical protein
VGSCSYVNFGGGGVARHETIADAGHSPFIEKTALVYEKLRSFLML